MTEKTDPFGMPLGYWRAGPGLHGPREPRHRTESELARKTYAYKVWRKAVLRRDDYTCQHCGNTYIDCAEAHHVLSFAVVPENRLDVSNGVTLCRHCHVAEHSKARADGLA